MGVPIRLPSYSVPLKRVLPRQHLGSSLSDISADGKAILFFEWSGPAGPLYLVVYRKLDGSAPTPLGEGGKAKFSPDGLTAAAPLFTRPPKIVLHPIGAGESSQLGVGEITNLYDLAWFPDGKHILLMGAKEGEALRTYEMDLKGGEPQPLGPADFRGIAVAKGGKRIVGRTASGETEVFDNETQQAKAIPGIRPQDWIFKWTEDGQALLVVVSTPWEAETYRVDPATGKRTLLEKMELSERAGSNLNLRMYVAEQSKTYVYNTQRDLSSLYLVEGLK